jgi:estrogen-related receptor beta like 1
MSDDEKRDDGAAGESGGPGARYQPFVIMEELLDKLKLLHYEDGYCRQLGMKPFSRYNDLHLLITSCFAAVFF